MKSQKRKRNYEIEYSNLKFPDLCLNSENYEFLGSFFMVLL